MRRWLVSCCPLIVDANGNLFGTTASGGANFIDGGTVFEIAKTANGYAGTPTTLVSFCASFPLGCADGAGPSSGLIADAKGNLFGTTASGGAHGSVSGNLISLGGTVFEVEKTDDGYASTPATLVSFCALANCADGSGPGGGLIFDADGNLFGTTTGAFAVHQGRFTVSTVFELAKITGGYTGTPTVLASFCAADNCASPTPGLIADSHGNLFGATDIGGANGGGTVFEIVKTARGYANTPTTLVNFCSLAPNCADGQHPAGGLIADAKGNLFGTTEFGGANGGGAVFEIVKTANGYASAPTTLVSFCSLPNCADGSDPNGRLVADAKGNLFGATSGGGARESGTVFEITDSGFVASHKFDGTPGNPNCFGKSVSALAQEFCEPEEVAEGNQEHH